MRAQATWLVAALTACSGSAVSPTQERVVLQRGDVVAVGLVAPNLEEAPVFAVSAADATSKLEATVVALPPNADDVRGRVLVSAPLDAPPGVRTIEVESAQGNTSFEVDVRGGVTLPRGLGRSTTLALGASPLVGTAAVWVRDDGTVSQRNEGVELVVPGIAGAKSVGLAGDPSRALKLSFAATASGAVFRWSFATNVPVPVQVAQIDGVVDLTVTDYDAYALAGDGRVWRLPLDEAITTSVVEPALAGVVAVRSRGRYQPFQGGAYTARNSFFLQADGLVQARARVVFNANALPEQLTESTLGPDLLDVTSTGAAQRANGRAYVGDALVHRAPVRRIDADARTVQTNSTNSVSSSTVYCLFDDGALWASTLSTAFGENQQGAGTASSDVQQVPVRAPGDVEIDDFVVAGGSGTLVVWARDGSAFVSGPAGALPLAPSSFTGLRRPNR